eukprot:m.149177 g.149177  ORF g.149177 m.149177 type:complete len:120 (+) comp14202_c1_seq4:745-1104(+)
MSKQQKKQVTHGPPTVANFMQGVLQLSNVHGQAMNACRTIKELGATLLGVDHATKIRYISKIGMSDKRSLYLRAAGLAQRTTHIRGLTSYQLTVLLADLLGIPMMPGHGTPRFVDPANF